MSKDILRIATRQSALALWQANYIKQQLEQQQPQLKIELIGITTSGDKLATSTLNKVGGKGLFVKELEQALLDKQADIAVHSMKDVPMDFPPGLGLGAICEREDPRDVFVSNQYKKLTDLPRGSVIGTSSLRRTCQLRAVRSDLAIQVLRGNVDTRLKRLDENKFAAIILAAAGLKRLNLQQRITEYLTLEICLPAVGQGALGIECRLEDSKVLELIKFLDHEATRVCVTAERAMNKQLNGGCQVPVAAYAVLNNKRVLLQGLVGKPTGDLIIKAQAEDVIDNAELLGVSVAENLLRQGAATILREFYE
jgi:hydroxymethylbilane synthase